MSHPRDPSNFLLSLVVLCFAYIAGYWRVRFIPLDFFLHLWKRPRNDVYRPELPSLLIPPSANDQVIQDASRKLNARMEHLYSQGKVDSIIIMVVTANGPIFSQSLGVQHPNETDVDKRGSVNQDTIYHMSSVTKLFTALELWILKEKGAISWDDDIRKHLPRFSYIPGSWEEHLNTALKCSASRTEPITLRQIASHLAGIPRDFPPPRIPDWPKNMVGAGLPQYKGKAITTEHEILHAISSYPLSNEPNFQPLYSNTGYALLGMAAVAAAAAHEGASAPKTYPDLIRRDIFEPLGLNGTSFHATAENRARVAEASVNTGDVDIDKGVMNASYGSLSSAADLAKVIQTLLDPSREESLISSNTVREWLRPEYAFTDDLSEVGLLWEIFKMSDSYGRRQRVYHKLGEFNGHYAALALNPASSFGVIVLMTGDYNDTERIIIEVFKHFQPAFDTFQTSVTRKAYAGKWSSDDSEAVISVVDGSMWMENFMLNGNDILSVIRDDKPEKIALAPTGREREFRLAKGYRPITGLPHYGCMPYWVINGPGHCCGAPVDIIYFAENSDKGLTLEVPSARISLKRVN